MDIGITLENLTLKIAALRFEANVSSGKSQDSRYEFTIRKPPTNANDARPMERECPTPSPMGAPQEMQRVGSSGSWSCPQPQSWSWS